MTAADPGLRARIGVAVAALLAALAIGPLVGRAVALDGTALLALGGLAGFAALACAGLQRLDLVLLAVDVAAIALLPAIYHRAPGGLDSGRPGPFYDWTLLRVTAPELLAVGACAAEWLRRQARVNAVAPRVGPIPLLALGFLALGLFVGLLRGNDLESCLRDGRKIAYVALAHWAVVRIADDPARRRMLGRCLLAALAVRALVAIGSYVADRGFHYRGFLRSSVDVGDYLGFLALIYLPAAQLRIRPTSSREKLLLITLLLIGGAGTVSTFSRAAWCAAPVGIAILLFHRIPRGQSRRTTTRLLVAASLIAAVGAPLVAGGLAERAAARVAPLFDPRGDSSVSYRLRELQGALAVAAEHPIAGIGLGSKFDAGASLVDRRRGSATLVHDVFLWSALKAGLLGLVAVVAILAIPALQLSRRARSSARDDAGESATALGLFALLTAFVVLGLVGAMLNQTRVAFALGLITGYAHALATPARALLPWRRP